MMQKGALTRPTRFAPGFLPTYFVRVPFGIHSDTICRGFAVTPMKETIFGCRNLFHIMTSLKNDYGNHRCSSADTKKRCVGANLREGWVITQGDPQRLDTDFLAGVNAFPYISKAAKRGRFVTNSGEIAGYGV